MDHRHRRRSTRPGPLHASSGASAARHIRHRRRAVASRVESRSPATAHPRRPVMGKIADMWNKVTGEVPAPTAAREAGARRRAIARSMIYSSGAFALGGTTRRPAPTARELRHLARRQGARGERGPLRHRVAATLARDPADQPRGPRGARSAVRPEGVPVRGRRRRGRTGRRPLASGHHDPDDRGVPERDGGELSRRRAGPGARVPGSAAQRRAARARQAARDVRPAAGRTGDDADDRARRVAARRSSCTSATAAPITCATTSSGA